MIHERRYLRGDSGEGSFCAGKLNGLFMERWAFDQIRDSLTIALGVAEKCDTELVSLCHHTIGGGEWSRE